MKTYLVGGAVRDKLLGLEIKERDWVVVGSTPEAMLARGFRPVGKEFPVFLHPETQEEYALARTERKVSKGYKGFTFHAAPDVTLAEDLARRDLTINAIAEDEKGALTDPFGGQKDLQAKVFRHVSPAFSEDPVRILRLARFACRFIDFSIHPETLQLMQQMVANGEVDALVSERVWQELYRALHYEQPKRFFDVLSHCNALEKLFPEIKVDRAGIKKLTDALPTLSTAQRFAVLTHDIAINALKALNKRYRLPNEFYQLAELTIKFGSDFEKLDCGDAKLVLDFIKKTDGLRREQRFDNFLEITTVCFQGGCRELLKKSLNAIKEIDTSSLATTGLKGHEFGKQLDELRLQVIHNTITDHS